MSDDYDFRNARRGAVLKTPSGKTRITIRIDDDVLDWFRKAVHEAGGGNYQTLMNDALRAYIEGDAEPIEETFRRILREELPRSRRSRSTAATAKRASAKKIRRRSTKAKSSSRKKSAAKRKRA